MSGRLVRWLLAVATPRQARGGPPRLTIVRHHRVYADGERTLYHLGVAESVLARQIATLSGAGLTPTTVADGLGRLREGTAGHHVAFSFDDGYLDNVTRAIPALARHGARATFYLTTALMEQRRAPWWDELAFVLEHAKARPTGLVFAGTHVPLVLDTPPGRGAALRALLPLLRVPPVEQRARLDQLRAAARVDAPAPCALATWEEARAFVGAGMEVGAHTRSHPFLSLLTEAEQGAEISGSVADLESCLGSRPTGLAYPNGDHDERTVEAARATGLAYAVTTRAGDVTPGFNAWRVPRRGLPEGACLAPGGHFSSHMTLAEVRGAFDRLRTRSEEMAV